MEKLLSLRAERQRREARRETFTTPKLVTTLQSILGPSAEGRPGPSKGKFSFTLKTGLCKSLDYQISCLDVHCALCSTKCVLTDLHKITLLSINRRQTTSQHRHTCDDWGCHLAVLGHNLSPFLPFLVCSLPYMYQAQMHLSMANFAKTKIRAK